MKGTTTRQAIFSLLNARSGRPLFFGNFAATLDVSQAGLHASTLGALIQGGTIISTRNPGRVAGLWYLALTILGPLRLIYIPGKLFVSGNAAATVDNIAAHELLFRFGIAADLICAVILIFLVLALYRLFKGVDQNLAVQVAIFVGVMPAVIYFVGVVNDLAALTLVRGVDFLSPFDKPQRDALAMLFLQLRDHQNTAAGNPLGIVADSAGNPRVQVAFSAAVPRRVARHQRPRLPDHELYGHTPVAALPAKSFHLFAACPRRRAGAHAMARDQGREAAGAGYGDNKRSGVECQAALQINSRPKETNFIGQPRASDATFSRADVEA